MLHAGRGFNGRSDFEPYFWPAAAARRSLAPGWGLHAPSMSLSGSRSELRVARQELERLHDLITQRHQDLANRVDDFEVAKRRWKMRMHDTLRDVVAREERRVKHVRLPAMSRPLTGWVRRSRCRCRLMRRSFRA